MHPRVTAARSPNPAGLRRSRSSACRDASRHSHQGCKRLRSAHPRHCRGGTLLVVQLGCLMDAFEAWLEHLFDLGPDEFDWYLGDDRATEWTTRYEQADTPAARAERIGRLFSDAGALLRPYRSARTRPCAVRPARVRGALDRHAVRRAFAPRLAAGASGTPPHGSRQARVVAAPAGLCLLHVLGIAPIRPGEDTTREVIKVLEATLALFAGSRRPPCTGSATASRGPDEAARIARRLLQDHPHAPRACGNRTLRGCPRRNRRALHAEGRSFESPLAAAHPEEGP